MQVSPQLSASAGEEIMSWQRVVALNCGLRNRRSLGQGGFLKVTSDTSDFVSEGAAQDETWQKPF